ncbi:hypothetical protein GGQ88_002215 [Novosphingobium hassiacum]|uniref:Sulfotransferase n=1 Tax=Novosphingobium hassiacum TaxID=173676 RepID=A0A7W5ZVZ9_9SPHN|nr:sulfotransferase [Novosphingobium hassiacum]MBB3860946.1 hypothetical protein [Novosphingobium hassiacum]
MPPMTDAETETMTALPSLPCPDALCDQAMAETGLSDWGPVDFREPLERLVTSVRAEAELSPEGTSRLERALVKSLSTRLRIQHAHAENPDIGSAPVAAPIVILGLPRSGTTNLHSLLAQDPAHRVARTWEIAAPFPPARPETYWTDPRIDAVQQFIAGRGMMADEIQAALPYHATSPAECGAIIDGAFMSQHRQAGARAQSWARWRDHEADWEPAFAYHKRFLQHLQTHYRAERWLLKSPEHLVSAATLVKTYPDAVILHTHRDPALVLGSVSSLITALRRLESDSVDPVEVGREQFELWAHATDCALAARDAWGDNRKIVDVHLRDVARAPIETAERVYDEMGMPLSDVAREGMRRFAGGEEGAGERKHVYRSSYALEDFGLNRDEIHERFSAYMKRFDIQKGA